LGGLEPLASRLGVWLHLAPRRHTASMSDRRSLRSMPPLLLVPPSLPPASLPLLPLPLLLLVARKLMAST
jgi:hypothetical protein